jgi:hypothetical protein
MSSRPRGMGMHCCRTPDAACLYSLPSITVNDFAFLAMGLASVRSEVSSRSIQARYLVRLSSAWGPAQSPWPRPHLCHTRRVGRARTPRSRGPRPWVPHPLDLREPPRFLSTRGGWAEVDRRFGNVSRKNIRGDGDSPRSDLCELIRLLVVLAGDVVELDAVKLVLEWA